MLGRKNYKGFAGYWPAVADDEDAHPADRAFSHWLNTVEKIVFSATSPQPTGPTPTWTRTPTLTPTVRWSFTRDMNSSW